MDPSFWFRWELWVAFVVPIILIVMFFFDRLMKPNLDSNLPPSPPKLPIVGHLLYLDAKRPYKTMAEWGKKYGSTFRLQFGNKMVIILNDYQAIKDALVGQADVFSGRPYVWMFASFSGGKHGIVLADGDRWKEQRKFAMQTLRDLGVGRTGIETRIQAEADRLVKELQEEIGDKESLTLDVIEPIKATIANIIFSYQETIDDSMKTIGLVVGLLEYFPFLRYLVPGGLGYKKMCQIDVILRTFYRQEVRKGRERYEAGDVNDFAAIFSKQIAERSGENGHYFNEKQLEDIIGDFVFAGQETTVNTLQWGWLYLAREQKIQQRVFDEIKANIGGIPTWADRLKLPYTQATIMEIQRCGNIVPLSVFHATTKDTTLNGYFIPKDTTVFPNLWAVLMDPTFFPEPEKFNPERFLTDDGKELKKNMDGFIPFSIGKRMCLGENLARHELFIVLTNLIWHFQFDFDPKLPVPSFDAVLGFTLSPKPYTLRMKTRNH